MFELRAGTNHQTVSTRATVIIRIMFGGEEHVDYQMHIDTEKCQSTVRLDRIPFVDSQDLTNPFFHPTIIMTSMVGKQLEGLLAEPANKYFLTTAT